MKANYNPRYPLKNKLLLYPWMLSKTRFRYFEYYHAVQETFFKEQYKFLIEDAKPGTVVLDFGMYIGDSAIYFAKEKNIDRVYAYERESTYYDEAEKNILCSPHRHKIKLFKKEVTTQNVNGIVSKAQGGGGIASFP